MLRAATVVMVGWLVAGSAGALELSPLEAAGKRLYLEGIGSSGTSVKARIGAQDVRVEGFAVPCGSCHGPDGKGRPEGGLRPPEITWTELAKSYGHQHDNGREHPAFDAATFFRGVTEGIDPARHHLDPAMPRYALTRNDADALVAYLQRIDDDHDPGLKPANVRLGIVLPRTGPQAEAGQCLEKILQGVFEQANVAGGIHGRKLELVVVDAAANGGLRERVASADVFALVSPLAPGRANELLAAVERLGLPTVGALAAAGSNASRYSFQLMAGEHEQGRVLAEFAALRLGLDNPEVVMVEPDADQSITAAVEGQLARHGWLRVSRQIPGQSLATAVAAWKKRRVELVFFFGRQDDFVALQRSAADIGWQPVFLTTMAHAANAGKGPIYLAAPILPEDGTVNGHRELEELRLRQGLPARQQALQIAAYAAATVMIEGLKRSGRATSRARLVDALENLYAFNSGITQPLSFGPGRRVGMMGAHVISVDPATGSLRPVSDFIELD
jgi:ABC-type branched-subunit amino acid transport system substrate-binding protein